MHLLDQLQCNINTHIGGETKSVATDNVFKL